MGWLETREIPPVLKEEGLHMGMTHFGGVGQGLVT